MVMSSFRWFVFFLAGCLCVACASGPVRPSEPRDIGRSTRYVNKGVEMYTRGCYTRALEYFKEAHERNSAADDLPGVAGSLDSLANVYYRLGDVNGALLIYAEALEIYEQLGDRRAQAVTLCGRAAALIGGGRLEEAAAALDAAEALGPQMARELRVKTRALLLIARGEWGKARELLEGLLSGVDALEPSVAGGVYYALGHVELELKRTERAETYYARALAIDRGAGAYPEIAKDLAALGRCRLQRDDAAGAVGYFKRSAKIFALLQDGPRTEETVKLLETAARRAGVDVQAALQWIRDWLAGDTEGHLCR